MHININFPGLEGVILKEFSVLDVVQELKKFMIIEFKKLDI